MGQSDNFISELEWGPWNSIKVYAAVFRQYVTSFKNLKLTV